MMFGAIAVFAGGGAWLLNDRLRTAVPRHAVGSSTAFPFEMREMQGLKPLADAAEAEDDDE